MREDLERMRKCKNHRGLRHFWGIRVRGQRTKATGRCGKTLGVLRKKWAIYIFVYILGEHSCISKLGYSAGNWIAYFEKPYYWYLIETS